MELEGEININENEVDEILKSKEYIEALNFIRSMRPSSFQKSKSQLGKDKMQKKKDNGEFGHLLEDHDHNNNIENEGNQKKAKKEKKKKKAKNEDDEDKPKRKNKKKKVE